MAYRYMWKKHDKYKNVSIFHSNRWEKYDKKYVYVEYFLLADDSTLAQFGLNDRFVLKISTTLYCLWSFLYVNQQDPAIVKNEKEIGPRSYLTDHLLNETHKDKSLAACGLPPKYSYTVYDTLLSVMSGASSPASKVVNSRSIGAYKKGEGIEDGSFSSTITNKKDINYRIRILLDRAEGRPVVQMYNELVQIINSHDGEAIRNLKIKRLKELANAIEDEFIIQIADLLQAEDAKTQVLREHIDEILTLDEYKTNYRRDGSKFVI